MRATNEIKSPALPETVAVVGMGAIGSRLARRLSMSGLRVLVWNRTDRPSRILSDTGDAVVVNTPSEAVRRAPVTIITVSDADALASIREGSDGLDSAARPDSILVVMSTVGTCAVRDLAAALPLVNVVDAPFLGSLVEAEQGQLRIFVGSADTAYLRVEAVLGLLGTPIWLGDVGDGQAAKLVANCALLSTISVLGETIALADGLGLARQTTFDVLAGSVLAEQAAKRRQAIEDAQYLPRYRLSLAAKDADLMLEATAHLPKGLRVLPAVRGWFRTAEQEGRVDDDYLAVLASILDGQTSDATH
jgi:3-hydroxyisobutyrate dehydrogenase/2-hydroxy-3-oxopropionate reductase